MTDEERVHAALQKNAPAALGRIAREARLSTWDTFLHLQALERQGRATVVDSLWVDGVSYDLRRRGRGRGRGFRQSRVYKENVRREVLRSREEGML